MTKKPTPRKRPETLKSMLKKISLFCNHQDNRGNLWAVLTALRGPDFARKGSNLDLKLATTAVIREAAGFKNYGFFHNGDSPERTKLRKLERTKLRKLDPDSRAEGMTADTTHFFAHARQAFQALGLDWYTYNQPKTKKKVK
jgi:hypothetical protein